MNRRIRLAALTASLLASTTAEAVPLVNTYRMVSNFTSGPIASVTQLFTLSFDPAVSGGPFNVLNYSASTVGTPFNLTPVTFTDSVSTPFGTAGAATFVDIGAGTVGAGTSGFRSFFFVRPDTGAVTGANAPLTPGAFSSYSNGTVSTSTLDVSVTLLAAAVPEPAAWASMFAGLALVGGALRHRRRRTAVAFG